MCVQPELIKYYYFFLINTLNLSFLLSTRNRSLLVNKVNLRAKFKHFPEGVSLRAVVLLFKHLLLVNVLVLWKYFMFLDMNPGKFKEPLYRIIWVSKGEHCVFLSGKVMIEITSHIIHLFVDSVICNFVYLSNLSKGNIQSWMT